MKKIYIGIDVSNDNFVVAYRIDGQPVETKTYENNKKGIKSFLKTIGKDCWCIMEATGIYHLSLALAISKKNKNHNENLKEELEILKDINFEQIVDLLSR